MNIDSILNGIVIDHLPAGSAMKIYSYLHLHDFEGSVAILQNVQSDKHKRKDIIKLDGLTELDWDVLGYLAPHCTVNVIKNASIVEKRHLTLPQRLEDIIRCKNPRCITTVEPGLRHIFTLANREKGVYRCIYCETADTQH